MKTLLKFICILVLVAAYFGCKKDPSIGLPPKLITNSEDSVLVLRVDTILPIGKNIPVNVPLLFDTATQKRIILTAESEVYVTFLSEKASWENSMGYYTYNVADTPSIVNKQILFPNISAAGSGGGLKSGDMVQLGTGKFPKGTVIGFYLVAQGWGDGHTMPGIYTHYTDTKFNIYPAPYNIFNYHQQHILFVEKKSGKLVLGFEDQAEDAGDYNNILVSISDSSDPSKKPVSFDLTKVPQL